MNEKQYLSIHEIKQIVLSLICDLEDIKDESAWIASTLLNDIHLLQDKKEELERVNTVIKKLTEDVNKSYTNINRCIVITEKLKELQNDYEKEKLRHNSSNDSDRGGHTG